jgi:hypothetical protein
MTDLHSTEYNACNHFGGLCSSGTPSCKIAIKVSLSARHWWLTPVILATQEVEIRRITVRSQPRQIVWEPLSRKNPSLKKGLVLSSNPSIPKGKKSLVFPVLHVSETILLSLDRWVLFRTPRYGACEVNMVPATNSLECKSLWLSYLHLIDSLCTEVVMDNHPR